MKKSSVILASGSPRRKELLTWAGISFEIIIPEVDETPLPQETPSNMVKRLSKLKAGVVAKNIQKDEFVVLAADTTVVSPRGKILGKPVDEKEALKMIAELQGKTHQVLTGYSLVKVKKNKVIKSISRVVQTRVTLRKLSPSEQKFYLSQGESMDKAGAYAAQGFGMVLIQKINGSYTNVVGLPMNEVILDLKKMS